MTALSRLPIHPDRVRSVLDPRLNDATVARLVACGRLRGRISERLGLPVAEEASRHLPAWLGADPVSAVRRAGAALHGQALRRILAGPQVGALIAAIGPEAHAFGLRHGESFPPRDDGGDLAGAILRDGYACLGAWLSGAPSSLRQAVLLSLPPGTQAEGGTSDTQLNEEAGAIFALIERDETSGAAGA